MDQIILEFSLYLMIFYALYHICLRLKIGHASARSFIIGMVPVSIIIALLPRNEMVGNFVNQVRLAPIEIGAGINQSETIIQNGIQMDWMLMVFFLYFAISLFLIVKLLAGLIKIRKIYKDGLLIKSENYSIVYHNEIKSAFSFFRLIFLPTNPLDENPQNKIIIDHERHHINLGHSFDKLGLQILKVFFWWHPAIHLMIKEIQLVHEYQVDEKMINKESTKVYSEFLINMIERKEMNLVNTISSHLKKRIMMMYTKKKNISIIQQGVYLSFALIFCIFLHSCQTDDTKDGDLTDQVKIVRTFDGEAVKTYTTQNKDELKFYPPKEISDPYTVSISDTIMTFDFDTKKESMKIVTKDIEVHKSGQQMPMYPGCDPTGDMDEDRACATKKFLEYIYSNLEYPAKAKDNKKEGMVLVNFIISDKGVMHHPSLRMDPGYGMGEAALKMINKLIDQNVKWIPGKVNNKNENFEYTLPVKFKLEG